MQRGSISDSQYLDDPFELAIFNVAGPGNTGSKSSEDLLAAEEKPAENKQSRMASLLKSMEQLSKYTPGRSAPSYKPMYLKDENGYVKGPPHILSKLYKDVGLLPSNIRMEIEETANPLQDSSEWNEEWYGPAGTKIAMQAAKTKKGGDVDSLEVPLLDLSEEELERQTAYFRELNEQRRLNLMQEEEDDASKRSSMGDQHGILDLESSTAEYVPLGSQEAATAHGASDSNEAAAARPAEDPMGLLSGGQPEQSEGLSLQGASAGHTSASFTSAAAASDQSFSSADAQWSVSPAAHDWASESGPDYEPLVDLRSGGQEEESLKESSGGMAPILNPKP